VDQFRKPAIVQNEFKENQQFASLRKSAKRYPMMIVLATVYPCNFGCPNCPYSEGNSDLRVAYKAEGGDYLPEQLWNKIADEAGPHGTWLRCTGGGEPMMHPQMTSMISYAKSKGCRIWLNTNGSLFGPNAVGRKKLEALINAGVDIIEFSMDAGDAETYQKVRPPLKGKVSDPDKRWQDQLSNIKFALETRLKFKKTTRIVVSIIRQKLIEGKLEDAVDFWTNSIGVDEVITRKFLSWDDNTNIDLNNAVDRNLYKIESSIKPKKEPCVWPFERLNIDTLGRVALCGQDISFRTSKLFPNANNASIDEIWNGETFSKYRRKHMEGDGGSLSPCSGCSAWKAGIRDWDHGWIKVLDKSGKNLSKIFSEELGTEVQIFTPEI